MLEYKNGWQLAKVAIHMIDNGENRIVKVVEPSWWQDMADKWSHLKIISIDKITATDEQKMRYTNIKDMPEDFGDIYSEYVEFGTIADYAHLLVSHPFRIIANAVYEEKNAEKIKALESAQTETNALLLEFMESL